MVENDLKMRNKDINRKMHESNLQNQRNLKMQQVFDYSKPFLIILYMYFISIYIEATVTERKIIIQREMEMRSVNLAKRSYCPAKL